MQNQTLTPVQNLFTYQIIMHQEEQLKTRQVIEGQIRELMAVVNTSFSDSRNSFVIRKRITNTQMEGLLKTNNSDVRKFSAINKGLKHSAFREIGTPSWNNLIIVELTQNLIDAKGCKYLSKGNWPKLQELLLGKNRICSYGMQHLSKGAWPNLKLLVLNDNLIDDWGARELRKAGWQNLELLNLESNQCQRESLMLLLLLDMPEMHWLHLKNVRKGTFNCLRDLIVKKFSKLDPRELTL